VADFLPAADMPSGVQFSFFGSFEVGTRAYPISAIPFGEIVAKAEAGGYQANPARVFAFEEIAEAHRVMEAGQALGKLVVTGAEMTPGKQLRGGRVSSRAPSGSAATPPGGMRTLFHDGERAVQLRAGVERAAAQVGRSILSFVPAEFGEFLSRQPFVVVASQDLPGRVWASLVAGGVGFARALDDRQILLAGMPAPEDPLEGALERPQASIGVLAIEFGTRQRIRLNGAAQRTGDGILLTAAEAFSNCTKHIQRSLPAGRLNGSAAPMHRESAALDARQAALVRRADTFFIASAHPERGADASHRGGRPGFVEVANGGRRLTFP